ncbi:helix-turn-helix domain-containing protein [Bradyrhizobium iriomotense]|uniref:helix-turn-helix domain-containing protein n=1 Tax=Bradyrhizobium iriomotense TaxID=441950 RepID=UPI001B8A638F|nr:AraC family transcriptional regulator [Bradyrhizobium iriomotense]MBR0781123.1 helix-turn-helix transcriptional regulator [Bradyrhizobium iriomotense]
MTAPHDQSQGHSALQNHADFPVWKRPFVPTRREGATVKSLHSRSWNGLTASVTELVCAKSYCADLCYDCARLSIMLDLDGNVPEMRSEKSRSGPDPANTIHNMNFTPAKTEMWAICNETRYTRHISFTFADDALKQLVDEEVSPSAFAPRLLFYDPALLHIARLFEAEVSREEDSPRLYGDSLSVALLLRLAAFGKAYRTPARGGLPPRRLRMVTDYLREHLADNVGLLELANIAQLSRSHFCRAFRMSTGQSPHQWLLVARIEKAKEMLVSDQFPIAEVAALTGFADQAHLSRHFSRIVGCSPGVWRRQAAS